jgi:hypothetical protein
MREHMHRQKGSLFVEYSAFIAAFVAAFVIMAPLVMRAVCGRWKEAGDSYGYGLQYQPKDSTWTAGTECYKDGVLVDCVTMKPF